MKKGMIVFAIVIFALISASGVCASEVNGQGSVSEEIPSSLGMNDVVSDGISSDFVCVSSDENSTSVLYDEKLADGSAANKKDSYLDVSDFNTYYDKDDYLVVTLKDTQNNAIGGATLTVDLNGTNNHVTDGNGRIEIPTKGLNATTYDVGISFEGDLNHLQSSKTVKLTVNKVNSNLTFKDEYYLNYGRSLNVEVGNYGVIGIIAEVEGGNVNVSGNRIRISDLDAGNHTLKVTSIPDSNHYSVTKTSRIIVSKVDSEIYLYDFNLDYGNAVKVTIDSDGAIGFAAKIDGRDAEVVDNKIIIPELDVGDYTFTVTSIPDSNHYAVTRTSTVTVNKIDSSITLEDINLTYGYSFKLTIKSEGVVGFVATIDGRDAEVEYNKVIIPELNVGNHTLSVTSVPDFNHNSVTKTVNVRIDKAQPQIRASNLNTTVGKQINLTVDVVGSGLVNEGQITFFNGKTRIGQSNVEKGSASLKYTPSKTGNYTIFAVYDGTSSYKSSNSSFILHVFEESADNSSENSSNPKGHVIVVPYVEGISGDVYVDIILSSDATGTVTFTLLNSSYELKLSNGAATIKLSDLENGDFPYALSYSGNYKYPRFVDKGILRVNKTDMAADNSTKATGNTKISLQSLNGLSFDGSLQIKLPGDATGTVTLTLNNRDYVFYVLDGICNVKLPGIAKGDYPFKLKYSGDAKYASFTDKGTFNVNKEVPAADSQNPESGIIIPSLDNPSGDGSVAIILPGDATGTVTLTINNNDYVFKVSNGICNVNLPYLAKGDYQYTLTYSGDAKYQSFSNKGTFKTNSNIAAFDAKVTYGAGSYYKMVVYGKDGKVAKGVKVTVKLNGKTFKTFKTDSKGIVKFKVTQSPGKYSVLAVALGDSLQRTLTVKHLLTLKKVTVKKSAKKLVLQANLGKINGKFLKNKKITFKFNGKTYKAKTDKKGIAKVTIKSTVLKKLKVGKKITYLATYSKDTVKKTVKVKK